MLVGKPILLLNGSEFLSVVERVYGLDYDDALFGVFGDAPANGQTIFGSAVRDDSAPLVSVTGARRMRTSEILTDLCNRGEIAPGDYAIRLSY